MSKVSELFDTYWDAYRMYRNKVREFQAANPGISCAWKSVQEIQKEIAEQERAEKNALLGIKLSKEQRDAYANRYHEEVKPRSIEPQMEAFQAEMDDPDCNDLLLIPYRNAKESLDRAEREVQRSESVFQKAEAQYSDSERKCENAVAEAQADAEVQRKKSDTSKKYEQRRADTQRKIRQVSDSTTYPQFYQEYLETELAHNRQFIQITEKNAAFQQYLDTIGQLKKKYRTNTLTVLANEPVDKEYCTCTVDTLLSNILALPDVPPLPREEDEEQDRADARESFTPRLIAITTASIGGLLFFVFLVEFALLNGIGGLIARLLVTLVMGSLYTLVVGGMIAGIAALCRFIYQMKTYGTFFGEDMKGTFATTIGIVGIVAYIDAFLTSGSYVGVISMANMIFQLGISALLGVAVYRGIWTLLVSTSAARIFRDWSEVNEGFSKLKADITAHRMGYICMMQLPDAMYYALAYTFEKELSAWDEDEKEENAQIERAYTEKLVANLNTIAEEKERLRSEAERGRQKREAAKQTVERCRQEAIQRKRTELEKKEEGRIKSVERAMKRLNEDCQQWENKLARLQSGLRDLQQIKTEAEYLYKETEELLFLDDAGLRRHYASIDTDQALIDCDGVLSKWLYLVSNTKDENSMAVVRKIGLRCKPSVFLYDRTPAWGNNLGEELCPVVEWLCTSLRRTNPAALLQKTTVVDRISGRNILAFAPYSEYITLSSSEEDMTALAGSLNKKMKNVVRQCRAVSGLQNGSVSSVDDLNRIIVSQRKCSPQDHSSDHIHSSEKHINVIPYDMIVFLLPPASGTVAQPSVLNEDLKQAVQNCVRYGIWPVFLVDSATWYDAQGNLDTAYLKSIVEKNIMRLQNVGKEARERLDLQVEAENYSSCSNV